MTELTSQNLYDIVNGSTLLASGGGGSIKTAYGFIKEIIEQENPVQLLKVNELDKAGWGCVVGAMGSPKSFAEIGLNGAETRALEVLEKTKGKSFSFVVPVETGSNIFVAMLSTLKQQSSMGIVDGDGAGRSVPTLSCLSFSESVPACPFALLNAADNSGNAVDNCGTAKRAPEEILINIKDKAPIEQAASVEEMARPILETPESFDGIAGISGWSMDAETAEQSLVLDTISNSQYLGEVLRESSQSPQIELTQEQIAAIAEQLGKPYFLFDNHRACTIKDIKPINTGGFDYHLLTFTQQQGKQLQTIYVINQNENLIAWNASLPHPIAMGPDLICMAGKVNDQIKTDILDSLPDSEKDQASASLNGLHGLSVEDIEIGQSLYLFALKANNRLREKPTADIFRKLLAQFGYLGPYVPIENLSNKS